MGEAALGHIRGPHDGRRVPLEGPGVFFPNLAIGQNGK